MFKKKFYKALKISLISVSAVLLSCILAFYILIVFGASKTLQSMWVCSAMTTMNHKYLATWFFTDEEIEEIMAKNHIRDVDADSEMTEIKTYNSGKFKRPLPYNSIFSSTSKDIVNVPYNHYTRYIAEGYTKLKDGIFLKEVSGSTWRGYVMMISDPMRVKLADTATQFEKGQTVKRMVERSNAIAGLNGGGFVDGVNYDSNGGTPAGLVIENGVLVNPSVPNDDKVYNMIGINDQGILILKHCTSQWALDNNIVSAVSFSPYLVVNGEGTIKNGTGGWGIAPRTAIGQRATGEFLFVVIDGRQVGWSIGCDLDVLQNVLLEEKAENGAMLDGGSSTVLYYNGEYVNRPSLGHERLINNCFIVTKEENEQ